VVSQVNLEDSLLE